MCDDGMVFGYGSKLALGACDGGLVTYLVGTCMVADRAEAISLGVYIAIAQEIDDNFLNRNI